MNTLASPREVTVITVQDELVIDRRGPFQTRAFDAIAAGAKVLIVDMRLSGYVDTRGMDVLMAVRHVCRTKGVRLILAGLPDAQLHFFAAAQLDTVFEIVGSVDRAHELLHAEAQQGQPA